MYYRIRKNVFETNSSSMHTLAIPADRCDGNMSNDVSCLKYMVTPYIEVCDGKKVYCVMEKYYGWNGPMVKSFNDKVNYLWAQIGQPGNEDKFKDFLRKYLPEDCDITFVPDDYECGVDHNSEGMFSDDTAEWSNFLENPYIVVITNDNE